LRNIQPCIPNLTVINYILGILLKNSFKHETPEGVSSTFLLLLASQTFLLSQEIPQLSERYFQDVEEQYTLPGCIDNFTLLFSS
jgi:hypothetical protein